MTSKAHMAEEDILHSLSMDELKSQNYTLRQAITNLTKTFEADRAKFKQYIQEGQGKKELIAEYEKKLEDTDVLLDELDKKDDELAEIKMENEACLEYENMVEEMAHEILRYEEKCRKLESDLNSRKSLMAL